VWESLPDSREFLNHLKLKAGLPAGYWSDNIKVRCYTVEEFWHQIFWPHTATGLRIFKAPAWMTRLRHSPLCPFQGAAWKPRLCSNCRWFSDLHLIQLGPELTPLFNYGQCHGLGTENMNLDHFNPDPW